MGTRPEEALLLPFISSPRGQIEEQGKFALVLFEALEPFMRRLVVALQDGEEAAFRSNPGRGIGKPGAEMIG